MGWIRGICRNLLRIGVKTAITATIIVIGPTIVMSTAISCMGPYAAATALAFVNCGGLDFILVNII